MQGGTGIGGNGGEQAERVIGEYVLPRGALHADHAHGALHCLDRNAKIGQGILADGGGADLSAPFCHVLIDEQRLASLYDLACQSFAESERREGFAKLIGEMDQPGFRVEQGDIDDVGVEDFLHPVADQLDRAFEFRFRDERLTDRADGAQLGGAGFGHLEQALSFVKQACIGHRNAHIGGDRLQQAHVVFVESILLIALHTENTQCSFTRVDWNAYVGRSPILFVGKVSTKLFSILQSAKNHRLA